MPTTHTTPNQRRCHRSATRFARGNATTGRQPGAGRRQDAVTHYGATACRQAALHSGPVPSQHESLLYFGPRLKMKGNLSPVSH